METHLVISEPARETIRLETEWTHPQVEALATTTYAVARHRGGHLQRFIQDRRHGVAPCSMKTLSGIANSYNDNLLVRAADVTLKERRRLILVPRETPLHLGHLRMMLQATEMGAILVPPIPAFYNHPTSRGRHREPHRGRLLDLLGIEHQGC